MLALARCWAGCQGWQGSAQAGGACRKRCARRGLWEQAGDSGGDRLPGLGSGGKGLSSRGGPVLG